MKLSWHRISLGVGALLREHRRHEELSQREAARRLGISPSHLSRVEKGSRVPGERVVEKAVTRLSLSWKQATELRCLRSIA